MSKFREWLRYDPLTGTFVWRKARGRAAKGSIAGSIYTDPRDGSQYRRIRIFGKRYSAGRLAVFYMTGKWPDEQVDHKDCNPLNNQWSNLRVASALQNSGNRRKQANNCSGFKGVTYDKRTGFYRSRIGIRGKVRWFGYCDTAEEAARAYDVAARDYFGEFARTNF